MLGRQSFRILLTAIAATAVLPAAPAMAQTQPTLGLYDTDGYPYYPIETQIYAVARFQPRDLTQQGVSPESEPARTVQVISTANVPQGRVTNLFLSPPTRLRPSPVAGSMIMDPWAVGVFR